MNNGLLAPRWPFVVFSLPRSRSYWLSRFLSYNGLVCGHDLALEADSVQSFLDSLWFNKIGTVETGAELAYDRIKEAMPGAKFLILKRPLDEIAASFKKHGWENTEKEISERDEILNLMIAEGVPSVETKYLSDSSCCGDIFQYLLGIPFDFNWWKAMNPQNLQIDLKERYFRIQERIKGLTLFISDCLENHSPLTRLGPEDLPVLLSSLGDSSHQLTVNPYALLSVSSGSKLVAIVARRNGVIFSYIIWAVLPDGVRPLEFSKWVESQEIEDKIFNKSMEVINLLNRTS